MDYENLSDEAKETLKGMAEFCINHGYCMGMDEGRDENGKKHGFVVEIEQMWCDHDWENIGDGKKQCTYSQCQKIEEI